MARTCPEIVCSYGGAVTASAGSLGCSRRSHSMITTSPSVWPVQVDQRTHHPLLRRHRGTALDRQIGGAALKPTSQQSEMADQPTRAMLAAQSNPPRVDLQPVAWHIAKSVFRHFHSHTGTNQGPPEDGPSWNMGSHYA